MIAQLDKKYIFTRPSKIYSRLLSYFFFEGRPATTKGRWFNSITFFALRKAAYEKIIPQSESPVFIAGTGRSGSTVLGKILSMHPDVGFLNEPKALWFIANENDDLTGSYSESHAHYVMDKSHYNVTIGNKVKSIYSSFLKKTGTQRIVDKYPEMIFRVEFLNAIFKNPKYIFLHRDPYETIASTQHWSRQHSNTGKNEDWWGVDNRKWKLILEQLVPNDEYLSKEIHTIKSFTSQSDKAAVEWILTMNFGLRKQQQFPKHFFPVSYNDLCKNPVEVLKAICAFTGLSEDLAFLNYGIQEMKVVSLKKRPEIHKILQSAIDTISQKLGYPVQLPVTSVTE